MLFRLIYDDMLAEAAYLIGCQKTGEAIVVDPERDIDRYIDLAAKHGMRIVAIAETHIHADFLSGARQLAEATGARLYLSGLGGPNWQYGWLHARSGGGDYDHVLLNDGDRFSVGHIQFQAMHTPGHTPEHLCYLVTDGGGGHDDPMGLLSGDFVFVGDLGRPDLLESAAGIKGAGEAGAQALQQSAMAFLDLPDHLQVWPAHGAGSACGKALGAVPQTTVGYERRHNAALQLASNADAFVESILAGQGDPPLYFGRMKQLNRDGVPLLSRLPRPEELGPAELSAIDTSTTAVLDLRPWASFKKAHLPGSLHLLRGPQFLATGGSFVSPAEPVVLICERLEVDALTRALVRIGIDDVYGWASPASLEPVLTAAAAATEEVHSDALEDMLADGFSLLDVRSTAEHAVASIEGAVLLPHTRIKAHLDEVPDGDLLVMCAGGVRSAMTCSLLERAGHRVVNLHGGMHGWQLFHQRLASSRG
jgi:hydroxyacylglutathione hydrolase